MAVKDVTISLQTLGGLWEFVGTDRARGVYAENLSLTSDRWGSASGSFDLRRTPRNQWPDIGAFSPCDIEIGGIKVWSGRVKGTPSRDGADQAMNVQLEGWQAHLDDDVYVPNYVHTSLTDWKDLRSVLTEAAIGRDGTAAGLVTVGDGAIVLGWPKGAIMTAAVSAAACAYLDLGPNGAAKRVTVTHKKITGAGGTGNFGFLVRGSDSPNVLSTAGAGTFEDIIPDDLGTMSTSDVTSSASFATARRYIAVMLYWASGAGVTLGEDNTAQVSAVRAYAAAAYEAGNTSNLKADDVVRDALNKSTILLSADRSQIDPANVITFNIPDLFSQDYRTAREVWSGVNTYHNFATKIDPDKRPVFQALPAAPQVEVGEWSAIDFQDASQGSGDEIYNRVIVESTSPIGNPLRVQRTAGQQAGAALTPISTPAPTNPSFAAVGTAGWTASSGTIARTTTAGQFDSAPAGLVITPTATPALFTVIGTTTGTFKAGVTYVLQFRAAAAAGTPLLISSLGSFGTPSDINTSYSTLSTAFSTVSVSWTPTADRASVSIRIAAPPFASTTYIDTFQLYQATPTLVDRRGFQRTKILQVDSALPDDGVASAQIGDTYLLSHKTTPFKGQIQITGPVREILTGRTIPPEQLLLRTTELIRLAHLIDPDTGAVGRDGRMVQATYELAKDAVTVDLDSTSGNFEALIARLGAISTSH